MSITLQWPLSLFTRPDFQAVSATFFVNNNPRLEASLLYVPADDVAETMNALSLTPGLVRIVATWRLHHTPHDALPAGTFDTVELSAELNEERFTVYLWVWWQKGCTLRFLIEDDSQPTPDMQGKALTALLIGGWKKDYEALKAECEKKTIYTPTRGRKKTK